MRKTTIAIIITAGIALTPVQLFAQGVGGTPLPGRPGDRAAPSGGVGGTAMPAQSGARMGSSSTTGVGGSAPPAAPGATTPNNGAMSK